MHIRVLVLALVAHLAVVGVTASYGPPEPPFAYDVVMPAHAALGLELDPVSLEVGAVRIPEGLTLPGTIASVNVGDRLVYVNGISLAFKSFSEVKRLLAGSAQPQARTLTFLTTKSPNTVGSRAALDFTVTLNAHKSLGANVSEDMVILGFASPVLEDGTFNELSQLQASGHVEVGDRIVGVQSQSLLGMHHEEAWELLASSFVQQKREAVRCRGPKFAVYCSVEMLPQSYSPMEVVIRPAPNSNFTRRLYALHKVLGHSMSNPEPSLQPNDWLEELEAAAEAAEAEVHQTFDSPDEGNFTLINHRGNTSTFTFRGALFGGMFPCKRMRLVIADPRSGCSKISNDVSGAAVLVKRGDCFFENKARLVQEAGGAALVVYNTHDQDAAVRMPSGDASADEIIIPAAMVPREASKEAMDMLQAAKGVHHVATGAHGAVWVRFSSGSECPDPWQPPPRREQASASVAVGAEAETEQPPPPPVKQSTAGASALLEALQSAKAP